MGKKRKDSEDEENNDDLGLFHAGLIGLARQTLSPERFNKALALAKQLGIVDPSEEEEPIEGEEEGEGGAEED